MNQSPRALVIATRVWRTGGRYRTRYYLRVDDGRVRLGAKAEAPRFPLDTAERIVAQLNEKQPRPGFVAFDAHRYPPRAWHRGNPKPPPVQSAIEGDAGIPW